MRYAAKARKARGEVVVGLTLWHTKATRVRVKVTSKEMKEKPMEVDYIQVT